MEKREQIRIVLHFGRQVELYTAIREAAEKEMKTVQEWISDAAREKLKKKK